MKAEQFIKDCTRNCSNETTLMGKYDHTYHEWLTPEQALRACEIARQEVLDEIEQARKNTELGGGSFVAMLDKISELRNK